MTSAAKDGIAQAASSLKLRRIEPGKYRTREDDPAFEFVKGCDHWGKNSWSVFDLALPDPYHLPMYVGESLREAKAHVVKEIEKRNA